MQPTRNLPIPQDDETFEAYSIRAHGELLTAVPDPDDRNELVWNTWRQYRGPTEEERIAAKTFSPDKYIADRNRCVFAEHETTDAKGRQRKYTARELADITRQCNDRIADVSAFAAISDGHTSSPGDPNPRNPQVLGYSGPYRIGMIGRRNPRFAIFADEFHIKEYAPVLAQRPRRSVELWTFKDGRMHFDPIAAIGSEAPRLPLPMRFQLVELDGAEVERYTFSAGAYVSPGAGSTNIARHKYGGTTSPSGGQFPTRQEILNYKPHQGTRTMLAPEDLQQIVAAIAETPHFKYLEEKMRAEQVQPAPGNTPLSASASVAAPPGDGFTPPAPGGPPGAGPAAGAGIPPGGPMPGGPGGMPGGMLGAADDDLADLDDLIGGDDASGGPGGPSSHEEPDGDEGAAPPFRKEKNCMSGYTQQPTDDGAVTVEKYTQLHQSHQRLLQDYSRMLERVTALEKSTVDANRTTILRGLVEKYGIDFDEEAKLTLHSQGGSMTDDEFTRHVAAIEKYAQPKQPEDVYIPGGEAARTEDNGEREKYEMALAKEVKKVHGELMRSGKVADYDECRRVAAERLKQTA